MVGLMVITGGGGKGGEVASLYLGRRGEAGGMKKADDRKSYCVCAFNDEN